jgi:hypothetical protein
MTSWNSAETAAGKVQGCIFQPSSKERSANLPQRGCSAILIKLRRSMRLDYHEEIIRLEVVKLHFEE